MRALDHVPPVVEAALEVVCAARPARAGAGEPPHHPLTRPQHKLKRGLVLLDAGADEVDEGNEDIAEAERVDGARAGAGGAVVPPGPRLTESPNPPDKLPSISNKNTEIFCMFL